MATNMTSVSPWSLLSVPENPSTAAPPAAAAPQDRPWLSLLLAIRTMRYVCLPIILFLGTFGNIMTIVITQRKSFEKSIINIYFTALAVSDMIFVPLLTIQWWLQPLIGYDVMSVHVVLCKVHTWLYSVAQTSSCWYLVSMTVHRAVSVVWPHRVNLLCTRRRVFLLVSGTAVFMALFYSHYLVWLERVPVNRGRAYSCVEVDEGYKRFYSNVFVYVELLVYSALPFMILVVSNSVLVWKLYTSVKTAGKHLTGGDSEQVQAREKAANSVTLTVTVVSLAFLLLTLPNAIYYVLNYTALLDIVFTKRSPMDTVRVILINDVCAILSMVNGAVNFYLYCLTGTRFRQEFLKIVFCCKKNK